MSELTDRQIKQTIATGAVIIISLPVTAGTIAYAYAAEPLAWWLVIGEAVVLVGLTLRLYFTMRSLAPHKADGERTMTNRQMDTLSIIVKLLAGAIGVTTFTLLPSGSSLYLLGWVTTLALAVLGFVLSFRASRLNR